MESSLPLESKQTDFQFPVNSSHNNCSDSVFVVLFSNVWKDILGKVKEIPTWCEDVLFTS